MSENILKKEFTKSSDVQRMRNLITKRYSDKTSTQIGYTKIDVEHKEGDIWEENGKHWTIKNGIKQTLTKLDTIRKKILVPLLCPKCSKTMKNKLDDVMYPIHNMCFDCVISYETELKRLGKFDEYQTNINKQSLLYHLKEMENVLLDLLMSNSDESFVTENGDVEKWEGNDISEIVNNLKTYIQNIKSELGI